MVKKIIIIFVVMLFSLTTIACGKNSEEATTTTPVTTTKTVAPTATKTTTGAPSSFDDDATQSEPRELETNASLPGDYPKDVFPIYPGSQISEIMSVGNGYSVIAHTDTHYSEVISFYKDVLKNASVISETEEETSLTSFGSKDGYTYTFDAAKSDEYTGFQTQIWISFYK